MSQRLPPARVYKSAEIARILGISSRTLYRMLSDGRLPEPMRHPDNGYRIWSEVDVRSLQDAFQEACRK